MHLPLLDASTYHSFIQGSGATPTPLSFSLAVRVRLAPVLPLPALLSFYQGDPRVELRRRTRLPLHHHPRPRPLVLHRRGHCRSQFLRSLERPVNVPKDLPREEDDIGVATQEDVLGLMRFRDDSYRADEDVLDVLLDVRGEVDLCVTYQRRLPLFPLESCRELRTYGRMAPRRSARGGHYHPTTRR
jgi:hypothetical protein